MAAVAAVVLNGGLVFFLAAWTSRAGGVPPRPLQAVPLELVAVEAEGVEITSGEAVEVEDLAEPAAETELPAPPELELSASQLELAAPAGASVYPPGDDLLTGVSSTLPPYAVSGQLASDALAPGSGADLGPVLISPPDLSHYYPRRALRLGTTGRTTVRLAVGADGRVGKVEVLNSTPAGVFEHAARRVGRALRFRPAVRGGRKVPASVSLNLIWKVE
jgi:TonB family protein